jgi:hypothetical protein
MALAADTGTTTGAPFAKFPELGATLVGALGSDIGKSRRQQRNFTTKQPAVKADGSTPAMEEILHLIAMPGTTAKLGSAESEFTPIEPGTHVRYAISGFKWKQVIDQRKALPAAFGFGAGVSCSGDVYTIRLVGWSAATDNAAAAQAAGFTVVEGRIVLRSEEDRDKYVLAKSRQGGNTNVAGDFEFAVRRRTEEEKAWEQKADELFMAKPWEQAATNGDAGPAETPAEWNEEPF